MRTCSSRRPAPPVCIGDPRSQIVARDGHPRARPGRPGGHRHGLSQGADAILIRACTEVETDKRADRTKLAKALADCKRSKATLVIAKLDRLTRNARFLLGLVESGGDVAFCDLPTVPARPAGKFVRGVMAQVAELKTGLISERTRAALAALKARETKLGAANPRYRRHRHPGRRAGRRGP